MGQQTVEALTDRTAHRAPIAQVPPDGALAAELHPVHVRRQIGGVPHLERQHAHSVRGPGESLDPARHEAEHGVLAIEDLGHEEEPHALSSAISISPRA